MGWSVERTFGAPVFTLSFGLSKEERKVLAYCPHTVRVGWRRQNAILKAFSRHTQGCPATNIRGPHLFKYPRGIYTPFLSIYPKTIALVMLYSRRESGAGCYKYPKMVEGFYSPACL